MNLDVLTLNLWNLSDPLEARMAGLESWLSRVHPDLLALQEVGTVGDRTQAHRLAAAAGYANVRFLGATRRRGWEQGLAVVADLPLTSLSPVPLPDAPHDETRVLQQVEATVGTGTLRVANTHLSWEPAHTRERTRQAAVIAETLAGCEDPVVVLGDLNDVHGSPPLLTLEEGAGLRDRCDDDRPTFAAENQWTWQPALLDRRVDHVLAGDDVDVLRAEVVLTGAEGARVSDHYGVLARIAL